MRSEENMRQNLKPIGIFDSGIGGLTSVKSVISRLPYEDVIYFGDTGRVPYGDRSKETIIEYATQDMLFLLKNDVKAVVIACNTADSLARLEMEQLFNIPIIGVVGPTGKQAALTTANNRIGVIGTKATVASRAYEKVIAEYNYSARVFSAACPLLVPLIEEGRIQRGDIVTENLLECYLAPLKEQNIDTLVLGCTHYPLLQPLIEDMLPGVNIINSGAAATHSLERALGARGLLNDSGKKGQVQFFVSDNPDGFAERGSLFIGSELKGSVKKITLE